MNSRRCAGLALLLFAGGACAAGAAPSSSSPSTAAPAATPRSASKPSLAAVWSMPAEPADSDSGSADAQSAPSPQALGETILDKESVRRVIHDFHSELRGCYERELRKRPTLKGKVVVRFMIGEDGSVSSVDTSDSKMSSQSVIDCAGKVFQTMVFPKPKGGMVLITFPLVYSLEDALP